MAPRARQGATGIKSQLPRRRFVNVMFCHGLSVCAPLGLVHHRLRHSFNLRHGVILVVAFSLIFFPVMCSATQTIRSRFFLAPSLWPPGYTHARRSPLLRPGQRQRHDALRNAATVERSSQEHLTHFHSRKSTRRARRRDGESPASDRDIRAFLLAAARQVRIESLVGLLMVSWTASFTYLEMRRYG